MVTARPQLDGTHLHVAGYRISCVDVRYFCAAVQLDHHVGAADERHVLGRHCRARQVDVTARDDKPLRTLRCDLVNSHRRTASTAHHEAGIILRKREHVHIKRTTAIVLEEFGQASRGATVIDSNITGGPGRREHAAAMAEVDRRDCRLALP